MFRFIDMRWIWFLMLTIPALGQYHTWGIWVGAGNYSGELERFSFNWRPALGLEYMYQWHEYYALSITTFYNEIHGSDLRGRTQWRHARNISFLNRQFGVKTLLVVHFKTYDYFAQMPEIIPLLNGGIGLFYTSPHTIVDNELVPLRPYATEGQYDPDRAIPYPYSPLQGAFVLGGGIWWRFMQRWSMRISFQYHWAWTDFLDDVSGKYPDPGVFIRYSAQPETAMLLSYRYNDTINPFTLWERQRGFPYEKDRFYWVQIGIYYTLYRIGCPLTF